MLSTLRLPPLHLVWLVSFDRMTPRAPADAMILVVNDDMDQFGDELGGISSSRRQLGGAAAAPTTCTPELTFANGVADVCSYTDGMSG